MHTYICFCLLPLCLCILANVNKSDSDVLMSLRLVCMCLSSYGNEYRHTIVCSSSVFMSFHSRLNQHTVCVCVHLHYYIEGCAIRRLHHNCICCSFLLFCLSIILLRMAQQIVLHCNVSQAPSVSSCWYKPGYSLL